MQDDGGEDGQQVGEVGRDISSTPSGDVEMIEGQDQEKKIVLRGENFVKIFVLLKFCAPRNCVRVSLTDPCLRLVFGCVSSVSFQPKEPKSNLLR